MLIYVAGSYIWTLNGTIFDLQPNFCDVTLFLHVFFLIFGPIPGVMALGTVTVGSASKFHAERSGREIQGSHGDPFRALFCFQLRPPILANIFVLLTPINQGYPPPHGQHSTLLWLKNSSLWWSTTSWLCGISHTNRPPGVGDHFCCP